MWLNVVINTGGKEPERGECLLLYSLSCKHYEICFYLGNQFGGRLAFLRLPVSLNKHSPSRVYRQL